MNAAQYDAARRWVTTPAGRIAYVEQGQGPVALFVHGVLLNGYLWRHQLEALSDARRCIAVDLLGHGHTDARPGADVSSVAQAEMLVQFLDALGIDAVDLVGNDSGGGIALLFAARHPARLRSLTLTDCDAHDNWPPVAFEPFLAMAAAGGLRGALEGMLADKAAFRSPDALGAAYEQPARVEDATIEAYLRPLVESPARLADLERFLGTFDCAQTVAVEPQLKTLATPTLVVWATDDVFFDVKWSHWLAATIPGVRRRVELEGAHLFFPEERAEALNTELRDHWHVADAALAAAATTGANASTTPAQQRVAADWVARFAERWSKPVPERFGDLVHDDTQNQYPPMVEPTDKQGVIAWFHTTLAMLPDLQLRVERWAAIGDSVLIEWHATATVKGRALAWDGADRFTLRGDKCISGRAYFDSAPLRDALAAAE